MSIKTLSVISKTWKGEERAQVFGVGDDNKVYIWSYATGEWTEYKKKATATATA